MVTAIDVALAATVLALTAGLIVAEYRDSQRGRWWTKVPASIAFVGLGVSLGALETTYGRAILAGLVLSLVGDVFLVPPGQKAFLVGLVSFLAAHVAYSMAFLTRPMMPLVAVASLVVLVPVAVLVGRWLLPHVPRPMVAPVVAYMLVITAMVALAVGAVGHGGARGALAGVGATLFFLSDIWVARDRFVAPGFVNRAWGLPLYYPAQVLLAWSAAASL